MKVLLVCSLFVQLVFSSTLPVLDNHGIIRSLAQRSKEVDVSVDADAYMDDIVNNVTLLFHNSHLNDHGIKRTLERPSPVRLEIHPDIVRRVPTATTIVIPGDPPPPGTEWDESIANDAGARAAVKTAWNEAMRMANLAANGLQSLQTNLNNQNFLPAELDKQKDFIAKQSPPMAQMFGSLPNLLPTVLSVFNNMVNNVPNINSGTRNGNVLRLALGKDIRAINGANKICGNQKSNCDIYAATYIPDMTDNTQNQLQAKYRFADSMIVFCPCFFLPTSDPRALPSDQQALSSRAMLDGLRTPGQTVVHEWSHLLWVQGANKDQPPNNEVYGYQQCAELYAKNQDGDQQAMNNADTFAVFASYHAYNQEPYAPTDGRPGFSCKDVWPRMGSNNAIFNPNPKPVKDTFP